MIDKHKLILLALVVVFLSGCSKSFWMPDIDKAETERKQFQELQRQNVLLERIANAIEGLK